MTARETTLALLEARSREKTVCPSEVARALAKSADISDADEWRRQMPHVHAAIDELLAEGSVQISWKGRKLDKRIGPYRIGRVHSKS